LHSFAEFGLLPQALGCADSGHFRQKERGSKVSYARFRADKSELQDAGMIRPGNDSGYIGATMPRAVDVTPISRRIGASMER
jgi:hypothetical protein